ncbi:hypothetical protein J1614_010336 [Plenodomus biglobosus]|nr:hypothetical protein J1614_010336 [Plenodomus biglobosus]
MRADLQRQCPQRVTDSDEYLIVARTGHAFQFTTDWTPGCFRHPTDPSRNLASSAWHGGAVDSKPHVGGALHHQDSTHQHRPYYHILRVANMAVLCSVPSTH